MIHATADVHPEAVVSGDAQVWNQARVCPGAHVGEGTSVGHGAFVDAGVSVGARCKIQNYAQVFGPARVEDGVFVGPGAIVSNDRHPRAVNPDGSRKSASDWDAPGVTLRHGASLGAGAVVASDVPDHALVLGVPARQAGWVGRCGHRLDEEPDDRWTCATHGDAYVRTARGLEPAA